MQREAQEHDERDQPDAFQVEDDEGSRSRNDELKLQAGFPAEEGDEAHERRVLGTHNQQSAGDLADAMRERHHEGCHHQPKVHEDHGPVFFEARLHELDRVEECGGRDQVANHVEDLEPPLDVRRVASGAGIGEEAQFRPQPAHKPPIKQRAQPHFRPRLE